MWFLLNFIFLSCFAFSFSSGVLRQNIRLIWKHICSFSHDEKLRHVSCFFFVNPINEFFYYHRREEWKERENVVIAKITKIAKVLNEIFFGDWRNNTVHWLFVPALAFVTWCKFQLFSSLLRVINYCINWLVFPSFRIYFLGFSFKTLDNLNPKESVGISTSCTTFTKAEENSRREAREKRK